uniref:Glucose transporter n=1 Tax=Trypanosoma congolense TaxID=5692 RepID=O76234_TRYCO|nr:glucose transporter [Trypanosoma congolense]
MSDAQEGRERAPDTVMVSPDEVHEDNAPRFFSAENLGVVQVQVIGGTLNGFSIGFVAVYLMLYEVSTNCSLAKAEASCVGMKNVMCVWSPDVNCTWANACDSIRDPNVCLDKVGYDALHSGIFACSMIVGSMIGSIVTERFITMFGLKKSFLIVAIIGVVASAMNHIAVSTDEFWVLCPARLLMGLGLGILCSVCPMYVNENAHSKHRKVDGVMFQVFITFGIMLAALLGLALYYTVDYETNVAMVDRLHGFCAVSSILAVVMFIMGIFLRESKTVVVCENAGKTDGGLDPNEYSWGEMMWPLFMGTMTAGTLQLTGINAVMNYAPKITENLGMDPPLGNFLVMMWNFVTALVAIPLASRFTMRQMFITCSFIASCTCLFLCGIPVFPGVAEESVKNGVATTGIALFIAAFEFGVGSCFFVLAQDLFPPSFRPKGASFVVMMQFVFNILVNLLYPITTEAISGGASGNQDKGQAVSFILFGLIGLVCFVLQYFYLYPYEAKSSGDSSEMQNGGSESKPSEPANQPAN